MAYTPPLGSAVDFTAEIGYTPPLGSVVNFDASGEGPPGPSEESSILGSSWALVAPVLDSAIFAQRWNQSATQVHQSRLNQRWQLFVPTAHNARFNQGWALTVSSIDNSILNQAWALTIPIADLTSLGQLWALDTYLLDLGIFNQRWQLIATPEHVEPKGALSLFFTATLTGAADSTTDLTLPISNWSARVVSGRPSYLSLTVPGLALAAAINARTNGEIYVTGILRYADGTVADSQELARANLDTIRPIKGARSASILLSGHKQKTYTGPKTVSMPTPIIEDRIQGGAHNFTCPLEIALRPLDTADFTSVSYVVGEIGYQASATDARMTVREQEV